MPTRREVGGVTQYAVGAPRHEVGDARSDIEPAPRAQVRLDGLRLGDGLHVPFAARPHFGATPARRQPIDIEFGMPLTCTSCPTP
ncbi:hypothetical protein GCM10009747_09560 [Agromyces humatus]|uniref:Uncharacterized protein n=1 Tax=Agromyces humatus TaxID=279573 RepID=A0ABP4WIQ8_9MICO